MKIMFQILVMSALIGTGYTLNAQAARWTVRPTEAADCADLFQKLEAADRASEAACIKSERSPECLAAEKAADAVADQLEAARCPIPQGDGQDGADEGN